MYQHALIVGASGGIGAAIASRVAAERVSVMSRSWDGMDLTNEASVARAFERAAGPFDLVFDATGALEIDGKGPEKTLKSLDPDAMTAQFRVNAIGPALLIKHAMARMPRDRRAVFATLSARVGSIGDNGLGGWVSYRASKAALNQIVRTASIEIARTHPKAVIVALHPGTVETPLTQKYAGRNPTVTPADAAGNLLCVLESLGPEESGAFYDWAGKPVPW